MRFKEGDKVKIKASDDVGTIIEVNPPYTSVWGADSDEEYVVKMDNSYTVRSYSEYSLELIIEKLPQSNKCECGAKFTSEPNLHARWCPLFRET